MSIESRFQSSIVYWVEKDKLVYLYKNATPDYWDGQWVNRGLKSEIKRGRKIRWWPKILGIYLPDKNSKILEAGCGSGYLVGALDYWGYKVTGIDYAPKTVKIIREQMPHLDVRYGDVRFLGFEDNFFDGYISLGVIEHFWNGYDTILKEIQRVVKPGGYVFLSVPCISIIDRLKIKLSLYKKFQGEKQPENFYQFALDTSKVKRDFKKYGFKCIASLRYAGFVGFARVCPIFRPVFMLLVSLRKKTILARVFFKAISIVLSPLCGDLAFFVMKNRSVKTDIEAMI